MPINHRALSAFLIIIISSWSYVSAAPQSSDEHYLKQIQEAQVEKENLYFFIKEQLLINHTFDFKNLNFSQYNLATQAMADLGLSARGLNEFNIYPKGIRAVIETHELPSPEVIRDLVWVEPEVYKYKSGLYAHRPRLYMFCRTNRSYPCLMIMKNNDGTLKRNKNTGVLWSQPSLGLSSRGRTHEQVSGHTPSGVWRIDGVMPEADRQVDFGQYRRMILQFVERSPQEMNIQFLLPASSHNADWWHESVIARDNGRELFRIHGTGTRSLEGTSYYPFVATSGCVAQRENTYGQVAYNDQRLLLDALMEASALNVSYENEENLIGLLYVINIDEQNQAITLNDLASFGIK